MNTEKTRLQMIVEQKESQITRAIVEAIEDGAEVQKFVTGLCIGGVHLIKLSKNFGFSVVLHIDAPEIEELIKPSEDELQVKADRLRKELEEIENQLKSE